MNQISKPANSEKKSGTPALDRRRFLNYAGITMATGALLLAGCKDDDNDVPPDTSLPPAGDLITFTGNDAGIINMVYVLEQLLAEYFVQVTANFATAFSGPERQYLTQIRDHEIAHRELLKTVLGADAAPEVYPDFSMVNFGERASVLNTAKILKDLVVSAYNGAGEYLDSADFLLLAGKIVSVEARHAALIRDLILNGSFANSEVVNPSGLDLTRRPGQAIGFADRYIRNPFATPPIGW